METQRNGPTGEAIDTPRHRALGTESRVTIMSLVRAATGGLTAADVAARTGQHLSTTRTHLERLVDAGLLVKARASGGAPGRPAWRYRATATDPAPAPYRALAAALLDHLAAAGGDVHDAAAQVGQGWGRQLAAATPPQENAVDAVAAVLRGLGFDPRPQPAPAGSTHAEVHLHACPFLDLVGRNPDAMCGLHAGVVRGVLEQRGIGGTDAVLKPFGAAGACVVRLSAPQRRTGGVR